MKLIWFILIGAASGWLAGKIFKGSGFGFIGNLIVGVVGGIIGGWVAGLLGISGGNIIWDILISIAGAGILFYLIGLFKKL